MDKDIDELISSLEKVLSYNCFVFNLSWRLSPEMRSSMEKDQNKKDQFRLASSEFEVAMRDYLSKEDFLRSAQLESLKDLRSSHKLAEHNIHTKIDQHYEFDGLYRYSGNVITVTQFLQAVTYHFRSYKPPELPTVNICPSIKEINIQSNDLIIFEMTSNLTSQYWSSKVKTKPSQVKQLLKVLKERNMRTGNVFLFLIHDGPQNNYNPDYSKYSSEDIDSPEAVNKKLYYSGFRYVRFEKICKLWLDNCPQEYKLLKALKKSRAQTRKHQAQNQESQAKLKEKEAECLKLTKKNKRLTKKLARRNDHIAKTNEKLVKQDKQLLSNEDVIVDEMREKVLEEMKRQASFSSYEQKEDRKQRFPPHKQSSRFQSPFASVDEDFEETEIPLTVGSARRKKAGRSRPKKKNLIPQEIELKESDFNMAYQESNLGKISGSLSPPPMKKNKPH